MNGFKWETKKMNTATSVSTQDIIRSLTQGKNPFTDIALHKSDICNDVRVIRALADALHHLDTCKIDEKSVKDQKPLAAKNKPANDHKKWTIEEDNRLIEDFKAGLLVETSFGYDTRDLSSKYKRTHNAIVSRLIKLKMIEGEIINGRANPAKYSKKKKTENTENV